MRESQTRSLVVDYYESFLSDRDLERYRDQILTRYTETTLARILATSVAVQARRGAVLALGIMGTFEESNAALGEAPTG